MPIGRPCRNPRCHRYATDGGYCEEHQSWRPKKKAFGYKRLPRNRLYSTIRWLKLRALKLLENPVCEKPDCEQPSNEVHHIKNAREFPELFFEWTNLEALCPSCHARETQKESVESRYGRQ